MASGEALSPSPVRPVKPLVIAAIAYALLTLVLTWPLAAHLTTHLPNDLGDPLLSSWLLWWHAHQLPFTSTWWDGVGFFPVHGMLALSDHRVGLSLIGSPIIWLGGSPVLAYNVALILSFTLSALSMYVLVLVLSRRYEAAALAGVVFGFAPYRFDHIVHVEIVSSYWLPLALLGLHQWLRGRNARWLIVFAGSWLMQALTCGYYFFHFAVLLALWMLWFLRSWREAMAVAAAGTATLLPLVPIFLAYRRIHEAFDLRRGIREIEQFSADVSGLLSGAPWLAGSSISQAIFKPEGQIYPGLIAVLLVALAAIGGVRPPGAHPSRGRRLLLGLAAGALAIAVTVSIFGPWRIALGPAAVSVSQAHKPFSVAFLALGAYGLSSQSVLAAWRARSTFAFYALATPCLWVLALGPSPTLLGHPVLYKAPYAWLMALPAFSDSLRVPARFAMLASLCLAVAAGLALARLLASGAWRRAPTAVTAALVALMIGEVWSGPLTVIQAPPSLAIPAGAEREAAVVELPLGGVAEDTVAMYHAVAHRRPVVNGYSGYDPPHYALLRAAARLEDPESLTAVARRTSLLVAIHKDRDRDDRWESYVRGVAGAVLLERSDAAAFYTVPRQSRPDEHTGRAAYPVRTVVTSEAQERADLIRDGRLDTAWTSRGPQRGGEQMVVELDAARDVCGVGLALGETLGAFPRRLEIEVSGDRRTWTPTWTGQTAGLAVEAALRDPKRMELRIEARHQSKVRFVKLTQLSKNGDEPWAIAEISVLGCDR